MPSREERASASQTWKTAQVTQPNVFLQLTGVPNSQSAASWSWERLGVGLPWPNPRSPSNPWRSPLVLRSLA